MGHCVVLFKKIYSFTLPLNSVCLLLVGLPSATHVRLRPCPATWWPTPSWRRWPSTFCVLPRRGSRNLPCVGTVVEAKPETRRFLVLVRKLVTKASCLSSNGARYRPTYRPQNSGVNQCPFDRVVGPGVPTVGEKDPSPPAGPGRTLATTPRDGRPGDDSDSVSVVWSERCL